MPNHSNSNYKSEQTFCPESGQSKRFGFIWADKFCSTSVFFINIKPFDYFSIMEISILMENIFNTNSINWLGFICWECLTDINRYICFWREKNLTFFLISWMFEWIYILNPNQNEWQHQHSYCCCWLMMILMILLWPLTIDDNWSVLKCVCMIDLLKIAIQQKFILLWESTSFWFVKYEQHTPLPSWH